jgi:DNA-binding beta-propeller fold protein YncE
VALIACRLASIGEPAASLLILLDEEGRVRSTIDLGVSGSGAALNDHGLWISNCHEGTVSLLDPATGEQLIDPVRVGTAYPDGEPFDPYREDPYYSCPSAVAAASDVLWVANAQQDTVLAVRPAPE